MSKKEKYVEVNSVEAEKMTIAEYHKAFPMARIVQGLALNTEGYAVYYDDGYVGWVMATSFDRRFTKLEELPDADVKD